MNQPKFLVIFIAFKIKNIMIVYCRSKICILISAILGFLTACSNDSEILSQRIYEQMQPVSSMTHGYMTLNLDSIANFEWDKVYFFNAEEQAENISKTIGFDWNGQSVPNLHRRLLFVKKKEVVSVVDFPIEGSVYPNKLPMPIWMFNCPSNGHGLVRSDAKFAVFRNCSGTLSYAMVPIKCVRYFQNIIDARFIKKQIN